MDVGGLANMIYGAHALMAVGLKAPEMIISEEEAKRLAGPILELQKYYKIPFDPKWAAWFQLITVAGAVYLPRMGRIASRARQQKKSPPPPKNPLDGLQPAPADIEVPVTPTGDGFKLDLSGA